MYQWLVWEYPQQWMYCQSVLEASAGSPNPFPSLFYWLLAFGFTWLFGWCPNQLLSIYEKTHFRTLVESGLWLCLHNSCKNIYRIACENRYCHSALGGRRCALRPNPPFPLFFKVQACTLVKYTSLPFIRNSWPNKLIHTHIYLYIYT